MVLVMDVFGAVTRSCLVDRRESYEWCASDAVGGCLAFVARLTSLRLSSLAEGGWSGFITMAGDRR